MYFGILFAILLFHLFGWKRYGVAKDPSYRLKLVDPTPCDNYQNPIGYILELISWSLILRQVYVQWENKWREIFPSHNLDRENPINEIERKYTGVGRYPLCAQCSGVNPFRGVGG